MKTSFFQILHKIITQVITALKQEIKLKDELLQKAQVDCLFLNLV